MNGLHSNSNNNAHNIHNANAIADVKNISNQITNTLNNINKLTNMTNNLTSIANLSGINNHITTSNSGDIDITTPETDTTRLISNTYAVKTLKNKSTSTCTSPTATMNKVSNCISNERRVAVDCSGAAYKWQMEHENKITDESIAYRKQLLSFGKNVIKMVDSHEFDSRNVRLFGAYYRVLKDSPNITIKQLKMYYSTIEPLIEQINKELLDIQAIRYRNSWVNDSYNHNHNHNHNYSDHCDNKTDNDGSNYNIVECDNCDSGNKLLILNGNAKSNSVTSRSNVTVDKQEKLAVIGSNTKGGFK